MEKNSLNYMITRPDQKLIIMRGISGSGKSTKAKELKGDGVIHSTDDVISSMGDYNKFFADMMANKDFSPLQKAHQTNLKNAVNSMKNGISPVIIDNTNLAPWEAKAYVKAALEMGFDDGNIEIVNIGTGGASAEELAKRNTHGVPLDKIKQMIDKYNSNKDITIADILKETNKDKPKKVLYSAVVLDKNSQKDLLSKFKDSIPEGWKPFAHHMTIVFGKGLDDKSEVGKRVTLTVTELGKSDKAMAVKVEGYPSANEIPHITLAVNTLEGGKPFMSNQITDWSPVKNFKVTGIVTEVTP
jgi:predicted kinase